jgi:uncharacterized protein with GYD domain
LIFITGFKVRKTLKEAVKLGDQLLASPPKGFKLLAAYHTLGRFDAVWVYELPNEEDALKMLAPIGTVAESETLIAIPREVSRKLV